MLNIRLLFLSSAYDKNEYGKPLTCRDCGGAVATTHTQELAPEQVRRYHLCAGCGRKSVSLQLEMGSIVRVPKELVVRLLDDLQNLKPLNSTGS